MFESKYIYKSSVQNWTFFISYMTNWHKKIGRMRLHLLLLWCEIPSHAKCLPKGMSSLQVTHNNMCMHFWMLITYDIDISLANRILIIFIRSCLICNIKYLYVTYIYIVADKFIVQTYSWTKQYYIHTIYMIAVYLKYNYVKWMDWK